MKKGIATLLFFISVVTATHAQLAGIGITLEGEYACDACKISFTITRVTSGSSADKDGLKSGDMVETIDNIHLSQLNIAQAYFLVVGKPGEKVTFGIKRGDNTQTVTVKRKDDKNNSPGEQEVINSINSGKVTTHREYLESIGMDPDNDGVYNNEDLCPNEKGNPDYMGCLTLDPEYDNDGDGVHNAKDDCPNYEGPKENKGCPLAEEEEEMESEAIPSSLLSIKDDSPFSQQLYMLLDDAIYNFSGIKLEESEETGSGTSLWTVSICLPDATDCKVAEGSGNDVYYAKYANQVTEKTAKDMYEKVKAKVIAALGDDYSAEEKGTSTKEIVFKAKNTDNADVLPNVAVAIEKISGKYNVELRIYR